MNNRIMAMLFALVAAMFISIVPVKAEAAHECKDTLNNDYLCDYDDCDKHVHHKDVEIPEKAATCTEDGYERHFKCNYCGHISLYRDFRRTTTLAEITIKAGHNKVDVAEVSATCTEAGVAAHVECTGCAAWWDLNGNQVTKESLALPAHGHDGRQKQYSTTETHHTHLCDVCGKAANNKAEHTFTYESKGAEGHEGTCTVCGYKAIFAHSTVNDCVCDNCSYAEVHDLVFVEAKAPTCDVDGNVAYYDCVRTGCNDCFADAEGLEELDTIVDEKLGHDLSVPASDKTNHWLACSREGCTARGYQAAHTTMAVDMEDGTHGYVCFGVMGDDEIACTHEITYTEAHSYAGASPVKNNDGTHTYTCVVFGCGYEDVQECTDTVGTKDCKCDHCGEPVHDLKYVEAKAATCRENGNVAYYECQRSGCGLRFTDAEGTERINASECVIEATGHKHDKVVFDEDEHWLVCTNTGCDDVKNSSVEEHSLVFTRVDGQTHTVTCAKEGCDYLAENVKHDDGGTINCVCKDCKGEMDHNLAPYGKDGKNHWQTCLNCGENFNVGAHEWAELTPEDSNGETHKLTCEICEYATRQSCYGYAEDCVCDGCGALVKHTIGALRTVEAKAATCDESGWEKHYKCTKCENLFDIQCNVIELPVIAQLQHNYLDKGLTYVEVLGKDIEMHAMQCEYCGRIRTFYHNDSTGDCLCDIEGCGKLAHSHTPVEVQEKEATCLSAGHQAYWKYACGKMFSDAACTQPLESVVVYPVTEHDWSDWTADGEEHIRECKFCGETESGEHADQWGDRRCDVCEVELELEAMPGQAATCEEAGWEPYWKSSYTGFLYADEDGNVKISEPKAIDALGHDKTGYVFNGAKHKQTCNRAGCTWMEEFDHSDANSCYCSVCEHALTGHTLTLKAAVPADCEHAGTQAYYECSCKAKYNLEHEPITAPAAITRLKHVMDPTVKKDVKENKHYIQCKNCNYKLYEDHGMELSDPNKGNYHQWLCECGELKIETHYDKNGDKKCDVCGHNMGTTNETTVEQHDNKTVYTGQSDSVNVHKDWFWNWQEWFTPSNSGGSSTTVTERVTESNTANSGAASDNGASDNGGNADEEVVAPPAGNESVEEDVMTPAAPSVPSASQTNILVQFVNWFLGLFGF